LLCAGCDYQKQRNLYKVSWQPDRRIKKLPRSATHQTVNFKPLKQNGVYYQTEFGLKLFRKELKQIFGTEVTKTKKKQKAKSAIFFVKCEP
jgi:hypothetical protein